MHELARSDRLESVMYSPGVPTSIAIGRHRVGPGNPCFVIAEVGVNHNGDLRLAHQLVDAAASARADAVKLQTFTPQLLASRAAATAEYQKAGGSAASQIDMLGPLALDEAAHRDIKAHADEVGLTFISSPFDEQAVDLLERIGVAAVKIASGELTNPALLRRVAATGLPIVMSTGMSTLAEVDGAVSDLDGGADRLALLHCVSTYPADPADCNLHVVPMMQTRFGCPVGWSDHTEGIAVATAAVALGAAIIEKHITLSRDMPGPDHRASIEPDEFRAMVVAIREVEAALGSPEKRPTEAERAISAVARRSLHWRTALRRGHVVGPDDLVALRPGTGISPRRIGDLVGRRLAVATVAGSLARFEDLVPVTGER